MANETNEKKSAFLNTLGKRKFIAFLSVLFTAQIINVVSIIVTQAQVVIFSAGFIMTVFSIYIGVKELSDTMKKKLENQKGE